MTDDARRRAKESERLFAAAREVDRIAHHEVHHLEAMAGVINRYAVDAMAAARREERAQLSDWFQETFCPRSGVPGDEKHARGDCDYCNMAAALRAGGPTEGTNE